MISSDWLENDESRFETCVAAVIGYYGTPRHVLAAPMSSSAQKVLLQLTRLFRVSSKTLARKLNWDKLALQSALSRLRIRDGLRDNERMVASLLTQHILFASEEVDDDVPREDSDQRRIYGSRPWRFSAAQQAFRDTAHGYTWYLRYSKSFVYDYASVVRVMNPKPAVAGLQIDEEWAEEPANDSLIWQCLKTCAEPTNWRGKTVLVVRGYAFALGLAKREKQIFEADGRIVLLQGLSASRSHGPSKHCLVFLTARDARLFVTSQNRGSYHNSAYIREYLQSPKFDIRAM